MTEPALGIERDSCGCLRATLLTLLLGAGSAPIGMQLFELQLRVTEET